MRPFSLATIKARFTVVTPILVQRCELKSTLIWGVVKRVFLSGSLLGLLFYRRFWLYTTFSLLFRASHFHPSKIILSLSPKNLFIRWCIIQRHISSEIDINTYSLRAVSHLLLQYVCAHYRHFLIYLRKTRAIYRVEKKRENNYQIRDRPQNKGNEETNHVIKYRFQPKKCVCIILHPDRNIKRNGGCRMGKETKMENYLIR